LYTFPARWVSVLSAGLGDRALVERWSRVRTAAGAQPGQALNRVVEINEGGKLNLVRL
jgi:hypothetical protein